jgi:hypothetical protein
MDTKEISLAAVIAAIYASIVILFALISFGPIQLRLADSLIPLSALFGMPAIFGVGLGAFIANAYYFLSPIDVVLGSIANIIAGYIIFKLKKTQFLGCVLASIVIGVIVGGYLWLFFPPPEILGLNLPVWLAMIVSITLSSLIVIAGIGYILLGILKKYNLWEI